MANAVDMKRDTHLTFGEICKSREALLREVEEIIDTAMVEEDRSQPLQLRFLKPRCVESWNNEPGYCDFYITQAEEHFENLDYVAVSYCWRHEQSPETQRNVPVYRIWTAQDSSESRPSRCPNIVLHRANRFARWKNCPYIWIDQECIDQTSTVDIDRHIQAMHRVYNESLALIAILSIDTLSPLEADRIGRDNRQGGSHPLASVGRIKISQDPWFSRTWTFQERNCAKRMWWSVPVGYTTLEEDGLTYGVLWEDYIMGEGYFPEPSPPKALNWDSEPTFLLQVRDDPWSWLPTQHFAEDWWQMQEQDTGPLRNQNAGPLEEFYEDLEIGPSTLSNAWQEAFSEVPEQSSMPIQAWMVINQPKYFAIIHSIMSACENLYVSDRLAIIANIHRFEWKISPSRLSKDKSSLSIALLALHMRNIWKNKEERALKFVEWKE
ncbi:hypothetical protein NX059_006491 [Plenodomus lindquistii]|nr:hypothetical protein NX059_006491 [Plenodomus lindquistii]